MPHTTRAQAVCRRQSGAHKFKLPRIGKCVTASIYAGYPPSSARIRRRSTGKPHHKLEIYLLLAIGLVAAQIMSGVVLLGSLSWGSHCILLCIPNSAPVLKVLVASLLSCMGSLVVTERHTYVQHLGWCELVLCSLICSNKSVWLGMLTAA